MKKLIFGLMLCVSGSAFGMAEGNQEEPKWWTPEGMAKSRAENVKKNQLKAIALIASLREKIDAIEAEVNNFSEHPDRVKFIEIAVGNIESIESLASKRVRTVEWLVNGEIKKKD